MNDIELRRERRRQRVLERLGSNNPRCVVCGYDDPHVLQRHHIAGRAFDDESVVVCANHHGPLSDWQKDHPRQHGRQPSDFERIGHFLLGLADLFEMLLKRLREFAAKLFEAPQHGGE